MKVRFNSLINKIFNIYYYLTKIVLKLALGIVFSSLLLNATFKNTVYETPLAISLEKGEYTVDTYFYNNGGILNKVAVGLNTFINLGIIEYMDGLIGNSKIKFSYPNVSAKIRFTDKPYDSYNFAIGYDAFYKGGFSPSHKKIHGVYFVYTQGFLLLDSPQFFSTGVRQPLLYEIIQPDIFFSLYLNLSKFFNLSIEIDNIHLGKQYNYYFILNNSFIFKPVEELGIQFTIQGALEHIPNSNIKPKMDWSRSFRIYYSSFF